MELNFVAVHYLILKALSYAIDKTRDQIQLVAPVTIEYGTDTVYFVYGQVVIDEFKFESQDELEKFFKDGRRYGRKLKKMILGVESKENCPLSPHFQELKTMTDFFNVFSRSKKAHSERKAGAEGGSGGQQKKRAYEAPKDDDLPPANPYELIRRDLSRIIGFDPKAPTKDVKRAYRKFMQMNHPDKNPDTDLDLVAKVNALMDRFNFLGQFFGRKYDREYTSK